MCLSVTKPVSSSQSEKIISAPLYANALAVAKKVIDGTMTECEEFIFSDFAIKYNVEVPELTAIV